MPILQDIVLFLKFLKIPAEVAIWVRNFQKFQDGTGLKDRHCNLGTGTAYFIFYMLSYTDLKKGVTFVWNGKPCEVIEANFSRMQQRKAVVQAKIKDLTSGKLLDTTFQASDQFLSAEIERKALLFLYTHRGEYIFADPANQRDRFVLKENSIGQQKLWLKSNTPITAFFFKGQLLTFTLPIKMDLKVTEAPPGVRGDRAQGGTKLVTLETGAAIQVPLFINTGDIVRVNTETGEYAERVEKA